MAHRPRGTRSAWWWGGADACPRRLLARPRPAEPQAQRREITASRSEFAKHFREPDGRLTAEISLHPVHVRNQWTFEADANEPARTAVITLRVSGNTGDGVAFWDDVGFYPVRKVK